MEHFVVVGAGQAGASLVAKLRSEGFEGKITLIGAEEHPPYQRPPLSKAYLLGEMDRERLYLRNDAFFSDNKIELRLGETVNEIDPGSKTVQVGEETLPYDKLALTIGLKPRTLPESVGGNLKGVFVIRTLADVDAIYDPIRNAGSALVVGGGYIGLEGAAVARKLGLEVTVIEMADRIVNRVASAATADHIRKLHQDNGVKILEGVGLKQMIGEDRVESAKLTDGSTLDVDIVIAGIGMDGCVPLAEKAGLACDQGIIVDEFAQTSDPNIWAAGDCTRQPFRGEMIRIESVQNAIDQGEAVAKNMLDQKIPYSAYPWFWSDQFDMNLQIAGMNQGYDRIIIRGGSDGPLSHWYYEGDTLRAVDAMSDPRAYMVGKRLIEAGKSPDPEAIADPETELKMLLRG